MHENKYQCIVCKKNYTENEVVPAPLVREDVTKLIQTDFPQWSEHCYICKNDLLLYKNKHLQELIKDENGDVSELDKEVIHSLEKHELISENIEAEIEDDRTIGEKLADKIADFGGSWTFLISFFMFLIIWILFNSYLFFSHNTIFDPYPFILLNLILSCIAAIQAPIIMMSQNRQSAKDRIRSEHDYQVNLKAEIEIRHLHDKLDHFLSKQWERLVALEEMQIDQLTQLGELKNSLKKD